MKIKSQKLEENDYNTLKSQMIGVQNMQKSLGLTFLKRQSVREQPFTCGSCSEGEESGGIIDKKPQGNFTEQGAPQSFQ